MIFPHKNYLSGKQLPELTGIVESSNCFRQTMFGTKRKIHALKRDGGIETPPAVKEVEAKVFRGGVRNSFDFVLVPKYIVAAGNLYVPLCLRRTAPD
jgi:hypothetical protein